MPKPPVKTRPRATEKAARTPARVTRPPAQAATQAASGKPLIVGAFGGRGTGKSAWVRQQVAAAKPTRLAVWDLMQENADMGAVSADLGAVIRAMSRPRFRVVFHPSRDDKTRAAQFNLWCRALIAAGDVLAYVEELAFVTTANKAPPGWRELCLLGRHDRVSIVATSQRPAQVDKEFMGNLDMLHTGRLAHRADAETVAALLGVAAEEVQRLPDLHWLERWPGDVQARTGVLNFASKRNGAGGGGAAPKALGHRRENLPAVGGQGDSSDAPRGGPETATDQHPEESTT